MLDKAIVAGVAFCCASAAFTLSVIVLLPLLGTVLQSVNAPEWLQVSVVAFLLFVFPVAGALGGIGIGTRLLGQESANADN